MPRPSQSSFYSAGGPAFSSATDDWSTPPEVFAALDRHFGGFELDACASDENHKAPRYFTVAEDGLAQEWSGRVWLNPPYGRGIGDWVEKAADSAEAGATVVCLVPARTCTQWWHRQVMERASEVWLVEGRLKFGAAEKNAPFPSAVVVYRPGRRSPADPLFRAWRPPRLTGGKRPVRIPDSRLDSMDSAVPVADSPSTTVELES